MRGRFRALNVAIGGTRSTEDVAAAPRMGVGCTSQGWCATGFSTYEGESAVT